MNRKRGNLQAFFAGIFDGEGHVGIQWNGSTFGFRAAIQMDDPQALMYIWREYSDEAKFYVRRHEGTNKIYYRLEFRHYAAYRFLMEVEPFLMVKREQVKVALSFLSHRRREHHQKRVSNCQRCQRFDNILKEIRARNKGVNSVNALLDYELREYRAKREDVEADVTAMSAKLQELLEGVETRDKATQPVEPISAPEQDIVHAI